MGGDITAAFATVDECGHGAVRAEEVGQGWDDDQQAEKCNEEGKSQAL